MAETAQKRGSWEFEEQQLVWGKVEGHPWWPGLISARPAPSAKKLYKVDFFGDRPSHSILPRSKILKYQDFSVSLNAGRPGPELKRAISEANIFLAIITESKCTYEHRDSSTQLLLPENPLSISPQLHNPSKEKEPTLPNNEFPSKTFVLKLPLSEETVTNRAVPLLMADKPAQRKTRIIRKNKLARVATSKQKSSTIMAALRRYRLQDIPRPNRKAQEQSEPQPIDFQRLLMRKLYKIAREKQSREAALSSALELQGLIHSVAELRVAMGRLKEEQ